MLLYRKPAVLVATISLTVIAFCMATHIVAEEKPAVDDALIKAIADVGQSRVEAVEKTTWVEAGDSHEGETKVELTPQQIDEIGAETAAVVEATSSVDAVAEDSAAAVDEAVTEVVVPVEAAEAGVAAAVEIAPAETVTITPLEATSAETVISVEIAKQDNTFLTFEADRRHACAIKTDNTLWCWGANNVGQLGNGGTEDSVIPTQVGQDADWRFVKRGEDHTCGIKMDASLWCWGANHVGQLGDGTTNPSSTPVNVGGTDWVAVDGHGNATCGTKKNGALSCWGVGVELSASKQVEPVVDDSENCGVNKDGSVWCWQVSQM